MPGPIPTALVIAPPDWMAEAVDWDASLASDADRMRLAIRLARENVERRTGGPFGAAIFEAGTGRLVSVGVNSVVRLNNCALHAEMVAFMMAQHRLGSFTLAVPGLPDHVLYTSCEPCAMCLGATLWSGVRRVVFAAFGQDAREQGFDEGPVFAESLRYLADRGIAVEGGLLREEGAAVLRRYASLQGPIYNG